MTLLRNHLLLATAWIVTSVTLQAQDHAEYDRAFEQARALFADQQFNAVIELLTPWVEYYPADARLHHGIGLAYFHRGVFDVAIKHLSEAISSEPEGSTEWKQTLDSLGMAHYYQGNWKEAIPLLETVVAWDSADPSRIHALAECFSHSNDYGKAREYYAALFRIEAEAAEAYLLTAHFLYEATYRQAAETVLLAAARKWPDEDEVNYQLGILQVQKGDHSSAVEYLKKALARNPRNALAWQYLGDSLLRLSRVEEALQALRRCIWLNNRSVRSYTLLAEIHLRQENPAIAEDALKQALRVEPRDYNANLLLAKIYHRTNRPYLAKQQMEIVERLRPEGGEPGERSYSVTPTGP